MCVCVPVCERSYCTSDELVPSHSFQTDRRKKSQIVPVRACVCVCLLSLNLSDQPVSCCCCFDLILFSQVLRPAFFMFFSPTGSKKKANVSLSIHMKDKLTASGQVDIKSVLDIQNDFDDLLTFPLAAYSGHIFYFLNKKSPT